MTYLCTNCGSNQTRVNLTRPSIDERYALGYCSTCGPARGKSGQPDRRLVVPALYESKHTPKEKPERPEQLPAIPGIEKVKP